MKLNVEHAILAFFIITSLSAARAEVDTPLCSEELLNVSDEMQTQYKLNVSPPAVVLSTDEMNPFPQTFVMDFRAKTNFSSPNQYERKATINAENFMSSPGIQLRLAKKVMNACPSTSKVVFGFANSGYALEYFRMPSGQIRQGVPIGCGRGNGDGVLRWGYFHLC